MKIIVSGSSGFVGAALLPRLEQAGHEVRRLVRRAPMPGEIRWDPAAGTIDAAALEGCDAVIHLAGAGIAEHRWTDDYKRQLRESRTSPTSLLSRALAGLERRPSVLLSASAIGWYGPRGDEPLDEQSDPGEGFLADLCQQWEEATAPAEAAGIRVAHLRSGIVLSAKGGALKKQLPLFKLGLGGKFGGGRQWQSWISLPDEIGAISHLLTADVRGGVNLTAPNPVTNAAFTTTLAKALRRPAVLPIPSFGPKLLLGAELAESLLYTGQKVLPTALLAAGYRFEHPTLDVALRALLSKSATA
ncbi:MAG: TIGR01777 family oxidoreductase [Acidimicrobiia bacterium]